MVFRCPSAVKNRIQQFGEQSLAVIFDGNRESAFSAAATRSMGPLVPEWNRAFSRRLLITCSIKVASMGIMMTGVGNADPHLDIRNRFLNRSTDSDMTSSRDLSAFDHGGHAFSSWILVTESRFSTILRSHWASLYVPDQLPFFLQETYIPPWSQVGGAGTDDAGQGSAQVVGHGPHQVGPHGFLFRIKQHAVFFPKLDIPAW